MQKIRKGDKVVVLAGKDKGRTGEVHSSNAEGRPRGRPWRQRQSGATSARRRRRKAGIISKEAPLHLSEHRDRRSQGRQADPRRFQGRRRQEGAVGQDAREK